MFKLLNIIKSYVYDKNKREIILSKLVNFLINKECFTNHCLECSLIRFKFNEKNQSSSIADDDGSHDQ